MVKNRKVIVTDRFLGILIIIGLLLQYVLPRAGIGGFSNIGVLIYLLVAIYLIVFG